MARRSFLDRLVSLFDGTIASRLLRGLGRAAHTPGSLNGASSFHLLWQMPLESLIEVSAVLEVLVPPSVPAIYFWALQVEFMEGGTSQGGAHTGLQWQPRFSGSKAVNWGGYASPAEGGGVLAGSVSLLPGFTDEPNTRSYDWSPQRPYRLRIYRSPQASGWRAEIADLHTGAVEIIRDLYVEASSLRAPVVWAEVFADCDAPSVAVRWSDFWARNTAGRLVRPQAVVVNYQSAEDGGCPNTDILRDAEGFVQVTGTERTTPAGTRFELYDAQGT